MIKLSVAPVILIIPVLFLTKILSEIIAKEQVDLQYEFLVRKRESDEQYFESMKEYMDRLSGMRHDFMNQIQLAYSMIEGNENADEGKKLLDSMSQELISTRPAMYCSNRMINVVLTMCAKKTTDNNIRMNIDVIVPGILKNEEIVCSVVNNMVQECIELTAMCRNGETQEVDFSMKKKEDRIISILTMKIGKFIDEEGFNKTRKMYDKYLNYVMERCDGEVYCEEKDGKLSIIAAI